MRVRTQHGELPVESLQVGDMVWAQDVRTGELDLKPVLHTETGIDEEVVTVSLDGEDLSVTPNHLFWTSVGKWVEARHLKPGDVVLRLGGQSRVERVSDPNTAKTANIVIDDWHTLFLGRQGILVRDAPVPLQDGLASESDGE